LLAAVVHCGAACVFLPLADLISRLPIQTSHPRSLPNRAPKQLFERGTMMTLTPTSGAAKKVEINTASSAQVPSPLVGEG
jgi:hypothetical protein